VFDQFIASGDASLKNFRIIQCGVNDGLRGIDDDFVFELHWSGPILTARKFNHSKEFSLIFG
jgi:hypothetical protein